MGIGQGLVTHQTVMSYDYTVFDADQYTCFSADKTTAICQVIALFIPSLTAAVYFCLHAACQILLSQRCL